MAVEEEDVQSQRGDKTVILSPFLSPIPTTKRESEDGGEDTRDMDDGTDVFPPPLSYSMLTNDE